MLHIKKAPGKKYRIFKKYSKISRKRRNCGTSEMFKVQDTETAQPVRLHCSSSTASPICDFCLHDASHNRDGVHEKMLFCADCEAKAHPSCMKYSQSLAVKALSYPWQCIECKTCAVCSTADDGGSILFCDACDKAYHMNCHQPAIKLKPAGKWMCATCERETTGNAANAADNKKESAALTNAPPSVSPASSDALIETNSRVDPSSPKAVPSGSEDSICVNSRKWSAADVAKYFEKLGFEKQAAVFLQEEIDGQSLLLLRRADVVSGLSLKLGPAVKIFDHIAKLQSSCARSHVMNGPS